MILKISSARFSGILRAASDQFKADIEAAKKGQGFNGMEEYFEKSRQVLEKMIEETDSWDGTVVIADNTEGGITSMDIIKLD